MVADGVGPEAEAVVMFGGEDNAGHASFFGSRYPLTAVEGGGVEDVFGFGSFAPFKAGEGIGSEVAEHVYLHSLPADLLGGGAGAVGRRGFDGGASV